MATTTAEETFTTPMPKPTDWTLLFKFHRTTLILPIEPTTPFPSVKQTLFTALHSTPGLDSINNEPLPTSASEIEFGLFDKKTGEAVSLEVEASAVGNGNGEEVPKAAKKTAGTAGVRDCPKGAGLKEGGIILFRFGRAREEDEWPVRIPRFDEETEIPPAE